MTTTVQRKDLEVQSLALAFKAAPEVAALAEKLDEFVHHHEWCAAAVGGDECSCGLWEIMNEFARKQTGKPSFDEAMSTFMWYIDKREKDNAALHGITPATFEQMPGRRYIRIVQVRDNGQRMAFCFIEKATGNVLKTASWDAPAPHARGTIFGSSPEDYGITVHGARYLR